MAIANFDEIIRRILGLDKPPPDDAQPFDDGLPDVPFGYFEDDVLPPQPGQELMPRGQILPYVPGNNLADDAGPTIIPNNSRAMQLNREPNRPLQRGNSKNGSGIDI